MQSSNRWRQMRFNHLRRRELITPTLREVREAAPTIGLQIQALNAGAHSQS
jgi:hypothetical protein